MPRCGVILFKANIEIAVFVATFSTFLKKGGSFSEPPVLFYGSSPDELVQRVKNSRCRVFLHFNRSMDNPILNRANSYIGARKTTQIPTTPNILKQCPI
jgi:hypothetical protein